MRQLTAPVQPTTTNMLASVTDWIACLRRDLEATAKAWSRPVRSQAADPKEAGHVYDSPIGWAGR